jgi:alginate O-acetyltransferase complex protein AlgJ
LTDLTQSPLAVAPASVAHLIEQGGPTDPSHDEKLRRGIIITHVSRPVAWGLTALFLFLIYALPICEAVLEKLNDDEPVLLGLFQHAPTAERLRQFEEELEQASRAKDFVQPRVQLWLTRFGRVGNKKAVVGQGGWLYYEPGVRHLIGPGFLDPDVLATREKAARDAGEPAVHPDPRPAIYAFNKALAARKIRLILFPVPDKAALQPAELHGRSAGGGAALARNRDWPRFIAELKKNDVVVFDPLAAGLERAATPRFLVQDTHWTPAWMQEVAVQLAALVNRTGPFTSAASSGALQQSPKAVARVGDIVDMLKLPANQGIFAPQQVTTQEVRDASGGAWEPDPKAEVLLLGDSFSNIFSMEFMGWGSAAGLGPQLGCALGRGVDVIAQNDSGAFATREALARELAGGEDRLAGKKVVIWEFASRELSVGDWKPVDWSAAARALGQKHD